LSQLSRAVETRGGDKKPMLSDLRESGSIEQDADMVQFIHRPDYYGITEDEDGNPTNGIANIIIAKHRNGAVCDVQLKFINELAKYHDMVKNEFIHVDSDDGNFTTIPIGSDIDTYVFITEDLRLNDLDF